MLHILLLILKITGIIIAAILGILVLLVCVVLFISGRYDIEASCDGSLSEIRAEAKVTWFLNLVRFYVCYDKNKMTWNLRIAWMNRQSSQEDKKTIKEEVETYDEETEGLWEDLEESLEENSDTSESLEETEAGAEKDLEEAETGVEKGLEETETGAEKGLEETEAGAEKGLEETEAVAEKSLEEAEADAEKGLEEGTQIWRKIADICQKIAQKITALYRKITGIPGKIKDMVQGISGQIEKLAERKNKIMDFISDEVHKTAFVKVRDESLRLLRKLKPRKVLAQIHYGFEDPYLTGKVLAGISMIYPFLGRDVHVDPDFERQVLEGDLKLTGRLRVSYFARLLWKLIWCKEVRMTYRHAKELHHILGG